MKYTITTTTTIEIPDELLAALRAATRLAGSQTLPSPPPRQREAGEDEIEPEHRRESPRQTGPDNGTTGPPRTGKALFGWAKDHDRLKDAQGVAKRLGYNWKLATLSDAQAQEVYHELSKPEHSEWGGGR